MADVSVIEPGRWGFSRIIDDGAGGWTTHAMQERLATAVQAKYPPLVGGVYPVPYAMVRLAGGIVTPSTNDTVLIPRNLDLAELTLGDLTAQQRQNLRNFLETWIEYQFVDWDGAIRRMPGLATVVATYTAATLVREVLRDIYRHLGHSTGRPKPILFESHNTEYLDNFGTDPFATRWTNELGAATWDSTNFEIHGDVGTNPWGLRYSINGPGSLDHEAQVTHLVNSGSSHCGGPAVRMHNTGTDDWYLFTILDWNDQNLIQVERINGGTPSTLSSIAFTVADNDWATQRAAAEGGAGANVLLSVWANNHGTSKPSDPGWFGVDGSPTATYTDTSVDRLDDAAHVHCGISARSGGLSYDTRHSYWKSRAISDRGGAAAGAFPFRAQHPMAHLLVR